MNSLSDEIAAYGKWGWKFTPDQLPSIPSGPHSIGHINVHADLENDDLDQNITMWQRTGIAGYYDLAAAFAIYYRDMYLGDFQADLDGFFGCHTFGWGLVRWAKVSGDPSFLAAANAIADKIEAAWPSFGNGVWSGFYSLRGPGRQLKLACALERWDWADQIWGKLRDSWRWDERGFWMEDSSEFSWATGASGAFSSFELAVLADGLGDYFDATKDVEVGRRLILMARWALAHAMNSNTNHVGHWIIVDFPAKGDYFGTGCGPGEALDPFYTCTMVNLLMRGYTLTGEIAFADRSQFHWSQSSKATAGDVFPYTNRKPDTQVGHFASSQMLSGGLFYASDGELPYVGQLFSATAPPEPPAPPAVPDTWRQLPNSSLATTMSNSGYCISPGPDGWSSPPDCIIKDWNGGIIDTKRKRLVISASGGHNSWFYNDVWAFDLATSGWFNLRKAYLPYMRLAEADSTGTLVYPDGSPSTTHTYDGVAYLPTLDEIFMIGGPGWNSTGRGPAPRRFSLSSQTWSYGTFQGIFPENGICSGVDIVTGNVWFRTSTKLYSYDVAADTYRVLCDSLPDRGNYYTALVQDSAFYIFGWGGVTKLMPGGQPQGLPLSGDPLPPAIAPGVAWEPTLGCVVLWGGGLDVFLIDLGTGVVTKRTAIGDDPGAPQPLGTYKRFGRVGPGQYLLMNSINAVHQLTLTSKEIPMPTTPMSITDKFTATVAPTKAGHPAACDQPPTWSQSTPGVTTVTVSADGLTGVVAGAAIGHTIVTVNAIGGGKALPPQTLDVTVTGLVADAFTLSAGPVSPQP